MALQLVHVLFFIFMYYVGKYFTRILYKPFPWARVEILRGGMQRALDEGNLNPPMRVHLRFLTYHSKISKFLMVFSVFQVLLIAHTLTDRCRWSKLAEKLAEYYKSIDIDSRPKVVSFMNFEDFVASVAYCVTLNMIVGFFLTKMRLVYRYGPEQIRNNGIIYSIVIPFILSWCTATFMIIGFCTLSGVEFTNIFITVPNSNVDDIIHLKINEP